MYTYTYESVPHSADGAPLPVGRHAPTDLLDEATRAVAAGHDVAWHRLAIYRDGQREPQDAIALAVDSERIGIAWGADATWADLVGGDVGEAVHCWLNDPEAWEARN